LQKEIIRKCNRAGKPVITATEMLESMIRSARPTRAETTDVANAIFDGTDAVMLSAETSIGRYPVQSVAMMDRIARTTERRLPYEAALAEKSAWVGRTTEELIAYNACRTAQSLGAKAIVAMTRSGSTAGRVSRYRPRMAVVAVTPEDICCRLVLYWGVHPVRAESPTTVGDMLAIAARVCRELGLVRPGDLIVITGGIPIGVPGSTNLLKVEKIT
jgi:pyruvate kinase